MDQTPRDLVVFPRYVRGTLSDGEGFVADHEASFSRQAQRGRAKMTGDTLSVMVESLERELTVYRPRHSMDPSMSAEINLAWAASQLEGRWDRAMTLEAELALECHEVHEVAAVPFVDGREAKLESGRLVVMLPKQGTLPEMNRFALQVWEPMWAVTRDERHRYVDSWWGRTQWVCLLTHPWRSEALFAAAETSMEPHGRLWGMPERIWMFECQPSQFGEVFDEDFFGEAVLRVFRMDWRGELPLKMVWNDLELRRHVMPAPERANERMSDHERRQLASQLGALPKVPSKADLKEVLGLINGSRGWRNDPADPLNRRLLEIGRRRFDLLLQGLDTEGHARNSVVNALGVLTEAVHREEILAVLEHHPDLVDCSRSWMGRGVD